MGNEANWQIGKFANEQNSKWAKGKLAISNWQLAKRKIAHLPFAHLPFANFPLSWWKITGIVLVLYNIIGGLLMPVPRIAILNETVRNQFYHVTLWFCLMIFFSTAFYYSLRFLLKHSDNYDDYALECTNLGLLFGVLGLLTGMEWAQFTWGAWWSGDVKQNMTVIVLLIYAGYLLLRSSFDNDLLKAKIGAVFNIFAFASLIPLLFIVPRLYDSLHPGSGGNPGFMIYDMDFWLRVVFYPSVIGWTLIGFWIIEIRVRYRRLKRVIGEEGKVQ